MATIKNIIQTIFSSQGAGGTINQLNNLGKAQTRLGQASASAGRSFAAQSQGLGGLVAAYAGAAATTFALQQAYDKLAKSARATQTLEGLNSLAASAGANGEKLLKSVQEATKGQLTIIQAAEQANLALSAGFNTTQIEKLAGVATKASKALGRDLTDAMTRVVRGSAKMETELLDELGIYTKIEPATRAYAAAIGKSVKSLSEYERRQAFVNSVIAEGERKFASINTTIPTSAQKIEAFGAKVVDIATKFGMIIADYIAPFTDFLTNNTVAALSAVTVAFSLVASTGFRLLSGTFENLQNRMLAVAVSSENVARGMLGLNSSVITANNAIKNLDVATLKLTADEAAELTTLKASAEQRALSTAEMTRASAIINRNTAAIRGEIAAEEARRATSQAAIATAMAEKDAKWALYNQNKGNTVLLNEARVAQLNYNRVKAAESAIVAASTASINANNAALAAQAATTNAVSAATTGLAARLVSGLGATVRVVSGLTAGLASLAFKAFGAFTIISLIVSAVGLLSTAIAKLLGKEREFESYIKNFGTLISTVLFGKSEEQNQKAFLSLADSVMQNLENANSQLAKADSFKFKEKFLGVTIEVNKTKEDLIAEVQSALEGAITPTDSIFGTEFLAPIEGAFTDSDYWTNIGRNTGAALGVGIVAATTAGTVGIGTPVAIALAAGLTVAGGAIGNAIDNMGRTAQDVLSEKLATIDVNKYSQKYSKELASLTQQQKDYAIVVLDSLTKSYNGMENFSAEARLALDTQAKSSIELIKQQNTVETLGKVMASTGKQAAELYKNFKISYDAASGIGSVIAQLKDVGTISIAITSDFTNDFADSLGAQLAEVQNRIDEIRPPGWIFTDAENLGLSNVFDPNSSIYSSVQSGSESISKLYDEAILKQKDISTIISEFGNSNVDYLQKIARVLQYTGISSDELRSILIGTNQDLIGYVGSFQGIDSALADSATRALSNVVDLSSGLSKGTMSLEQYDQAISAAKASLADANFQLEEEAKLRANISTLTSVEQNTIRGLTQANQDNIDTNRTQIALLEKQVAAYESQKQVLQDNIKLLDYLKSITPKETSSLEFAQSLAAAAKGTSGDFEALAVAVKVVGIDTARANSEMETLKNQLDKLPKGTLTDAMKQDIIGTAGDSAVELENLAAKYEKLRVISGDLYVQSAGGWLKVNTRTAEGIRLLNTYDAGTAALVERGKQLLINGQAQVFSLGEELKQLELKISNQKDSLTISQAENAIKAAELEVSKQISAIENDTKSKERQLEFITQSLNIQKQLTDAAVKQRETEISAIEAKAALEEAAAQSALDKLKAQKQEQQALLDLQSKAYDIRISSLQAQTDPAIAEAAIRVSDFTNITSVLSDTYAKQVELAGVQSQLFVSQLQGYKKDYENQLAIIASEKQIAENKVAKEVQILELQKQNALDLQNQAAKELAAQVRINDIRASILENERTLELTKIDGDIASVKAQADLVVQKADIDKKQLDANISLESEKATRAARQLIDQYNLLESQSVAFNAFLTDYQALLDEQARLNGNTGGTSIQITASQDFSAKKAELIGSIAAIGIAYSELRKEGKKAIDEQTDASLAALSVELTAVEARKKAQEEYYSSKASLEKASGEAAIESLKVELAARAQEYNNFISQLKAKQDELTAITEESTESQKQAYLDYINNVVAAFGALQAKVYSIASAAAAQTNSLNALAISISSDKNTLVFRQQEVALAKEIGTIQNSISVKQSELNLLKAQESAASSSGLSTQERMLTMKKQEIEFQAELNKIEAAGQERKLQYLVEQGKKAATLFENNDSAIGLAGSIAALAGVFVNQQQIIELQKQQAERAYKDELALIEIDRQLLEEEKKAKGGAAAASAKVIEAERGILLEQQALAVKELERDINNQKAAVQQLEAEKTLQLNQAQIDGIRAQNDIAANRARLDAVEKESVVLSGFINELQDAIPRAFNTVLSRLGLTIDNHFDRIDLAKDINFDDVRAQLTAAETQFNAVYGDVANKQGEIFTNISNNADLSIEAANSELALLEQRRADLEVIQRNELAAFDAKSKAQAAGAAAEIAEIDKREKELKLRLANANATYSEAMEKATQDAAAAMQEFATAIIEKVGKYLVNQQTKKIEQAKVNESVINEALTATSEKLQEAQSKAGEALSKEISLRDELTTATESLIQNQKAYIKSVSGREDSILESSKIYIQSILDQKKKALDLSKTMSERLRLDDQVKSLEDRKISLEARLTEATNIRINEENKLAEIQKIISIVTDIASGKLASFAQQIQTVAASANAMFAGGGNLGQAFMSAFGFDKIVSGFQSVTSSLLGAGNSLASAGNALTNSAQSLAVTTSKIPPANPFYGAGATGATAGASATGAGAAGGFWGTIGGAIGGGLTGFGVGSIIGALTNDPGMGSTIGGAIGGALASGLAIAIPSLFASGTFLGGLTTAMGGALGTFGFAASMAIPVVGAIVGALIGRLFSKTPTASATGKLTSAGAELTSTSQQKVPGGTAKTLGNIGADALEGFIDGLKSAGIAFKDVVYWSISLKKNSITGASLTYQNGASFSMGSRGTSSSDIQATAQFYIDSFVKGLRQGSLVVDKAILNAADLQRAIDKFVSDDQDTKTVDRLEYVLDYASKFSGLLNDIGQAVPTTMSEAYSQIEKGSQAAGASLAAQYTSLLKEAGSVFGSSSEQYAELNTRIQGNVLAQLGLVKAADGTIVSISSATEALNAGSIGIANIIETVNGYTKAVIASGKSAQETADIIRIATTVQLSDFVTSIAEGLTESIEVLKNPAKAAVSELQDIIEGAVKRSEDLKGAADELVKRGNFEFIDQAVKNYADSIELASLEIASYLSTLNVEQLKAVVADERITDARAKSAAATRLAELQEVDRTVAVKNFVKISKDFNKTIAEITDSFSVPQFLQVATNTVEVMQMLGKTSVDDFSNNFASLVNNIAKGENLVDNFSNGITMLNDEYTSGAITASQYTDALDLLQSTTLDSIQVFSDLTKAVSDTASEIADIYSGLLDNLVSTTEDIGSTLIELLDTFQAKSTDILKVYDNTLRGVAESGNEILDLRDTAASAYESASAAVQEFDKANKLSGRSSSQVREQIASIQAQLDSLSSKSFDFSSFLNFGKLTSQQRALQAELTTLTSKEAERTKLLEAQTIARNDLAVADATIATLGTKLVDSRLKESELVQKIEAATVDFTRSQKDLADITELLATANFDLNQARFDEQDSVKETSRLLLELSGVAKQLNFEVAGLSSSFLDTLVSATESNAGIKYQAPEYDATRAALIQQAIDDTTAYYNSLVAVGAEITNLTDPFMSIAEPVQALASELDIYSYMITDRFKGFSEELVRYLDTDGMALFYGEGGKFSQFRDSLLRTLVVQGFDVLTATGGPLDGFTARLGAITLAYTQLESSGNTLNTTVATLKQTFGELITVIGEDNKGVIGVVQALVTDVADVENYTVPTFTVQSGIGKAINDYLKGVNAASNYTAITLSKDQANSLGMAINNYVVSINDATKYSAINLSNTAGIGLSIQSFLTSLSTFTGFTAPTISATEGIGKAIGDFLTNLNSSTFVQASATNGIGQAIQSWLSSFNNATTGTSKLTPPVFSSTDGIGGSVQTFLTALRNSTSYTAPTVAKATAGNIGNTIQLFLDALKTGSTYTAPTVAVDSGPGKLVQDYLTSLNTKTGFTAPAVTTATAGTVGNAMGAFLTSLNTATGFSAPKLTIATAGTVGNSMDAFVDGLDTATGFTAPTLTTAKTGTVGAAMTTFVTGLNTATGFAAPKLTTTTADTVGNAMGAFLTNLNTTTGFAAPSLTSATTGTVGNAMSSFVSGLNTATGFTAPAITTSANGTIGNAMSTFLTNLNTTTGFTAPALTNTTVGTVGKAMDSFVSSLDSATGFSAPTLTTSTNGSIGSALNAFLTNLNSSGSFSAPALTTTTSGSIGAALGSFLASLNTTTGFTAPTLTSTAAGTIGKAMDAFVSGLDTATGFKAPTLTTATAGTVGKGLVTFLASLDTTTGFKAPDLTTATAGTVGKGLVTFLAALDTTTGFKAPDLTTTTAGTVGKGLSTFLAALDTTTGFTAPTLTTATAGTVGKGLSTFLAALDTTTGFTAPTLTTTTAGTVGNAMNAFLTNLNTKTGFTAPTLTTTGAGTAGKAIDTFIANLNTSTAFTAPTLSTTAGVGKSIQDYINSIKDTLTPSIGGIADVFTDARVSKITLFKNAVSELDSVGATISNSDALLKAVGNLLTNSGSAVTSIGNLADKFTSMNTALKPLMDTLSAAGAVTTKGTLTLAQEKITSLATAIKDAWDKVVFQLPTDLAKGITLNASVSTPPALSKADSDNLATMATNSSKYPRIQNVTYTTAGAFASGGLVEGPGSATSDSIPARLSNGEYVIKASSVRSLGTDVLDSLNRTGNLGSTIANKGRKGDSMVAHINPAEAAMLKKAGGSGTINPKTGLLEFFNADAGAVGKVFRDQEINLLTSMFANTAYNIPGNATSVGYGQVNARKDADSSNINSNSYSGYLQGWNEPYAVDRYGRWSYLYKNALSQGGPIQNLDQYRDHNLMLKDSTDIVNYSGSARGLPNVSVQSSNVGSKGYAMASYPSGTLAKADPYLEYYTDYVTQWENYVISYYPYKTGTRLVTKPEQKSRWVYPQAQYQSYIGYQAVPVDNTSLNSITANMGGTNLAYTSAQLGVNNIADRGTKLLNGYSRAQSGVDIGSYTDRPIDRSLITSYVDAMNMGNLGNFTDFYMLNSSLSKHKGSFPNSDPYAATLGTQIPVPRSSGGLMKGRDSIPALLEPGEFVLRKQAVDMMGLDNAIKLNSTGNAGNGDIEVEVNINNNGTSQTAVGTPEVRRENGKIVVDIILEDLRNNGPINRQIRSIR